MLNVIKLFHRTISAINFSKYFSIMFTKMSLIVPNEKYFQLLDTVFEYEKQIYKIIEASRKSNEIT